MRRSILLALLLALFVGGVYIYYHKQHSSDGMITLYGNVDIRDVNLGFRVFGRIEKLNFEEGDHVKTGEVLAVLDKKPYNDNVVAAKADLDDKTAALKIAELVYDRKKELLGAKFASQQAYDDAAAIKNRATAALHGAQANLTDANIKLADTDILAPSDGVILTRVREPGTIVNPGDTVYVMAVDDPVWVRAYISETELGKIFPGMLAKIYTDSRPEDAYEGQIGFISPVAEFTPKNVETPDLRTKLVYRLRITISNKDRYLRQGMPVTVKIDPRQSHDKS